MSADRGPREPGLVDVAYGYALAVVVVLIVVATLGVLTWRAFG